ncbi:MAG: transposase [Acidobacteriota bacterium]
MGGRTPWAATLRMSRAAPASVHAPTAPSRCCSFSRVQAFASYARLVKGAHTSAGKALGSGGAKMGNVHLNGAFSEAAVLFLRQAPGGKTLLAEIEKKTAQAQPCRFSLTRSGGPSSTCGRVARCSRWTHSARRSGEGSG